MDPAAEFYLSMPWANLFEQADAHGVAFRCKGCSEIVPVGERERHYNAHRGAKRRSETARQARISRERVARLAGARKATTNRRERVA